MVSLFLGDIRGALIVILTTQPVLFSGVLFLQLFGTDNQYHDIEWPYPLHWNFWWMNPLVTMEKYPPALRHGQAEGIGDWGCLQGNSISELLILFVSSLFSLLAFSMQAFPGFNFSRWRWRLVFYGDILLPLTDFCFCHCQLVTRKITRNQKTKWRQPVIISIN